MVAAVVGEVPIRGDSPAGRLGWSSITAGIGDGVVAVALPLLAAKLTADPIKVCLVVAAQHLPWTGVALGWHRVGGDRRTVLGLVDTARAMVLGLLGIAVVLGRETLPLVLLAAVAAGLGEALTDSAETEADDVSGLSTRGMVGMAIGLLLGGVLYEVFPATPFLFDVLAFTMASTFALVTSGPRLPAAVDEPAPRLASPPAPTRSTVVAVGLSSLAASMVLGVLVLFALHDLGLGAPAFGLVLAGLAASSMVGGLVAPEVGHVLGLRTGLAASFAFAAAGYAAAAGLADERLPWLSVLALGVASAGGMVGAVLGRAHLQRHTGTTPLERLIGLLHLVSWAVIPCGAVLGGAIASRTSVPGALVAAAAVSLAAAGLVALPQVTAAQEIN